MKKIKFIASLIFLLLTVQLTLADTLPEKVLKRLKGASVFISNGSGSGSGFLFAKNNHMGYIATNAHVIDGSKEVDITFNSGEKGEYTTKGTVVAVNIKQDLAIVKVSSKNLPYCLPLQKNEKLLKKKMRLYAIGFPFGKDLADGPKKKPSVTISQGEITDLLKNDDGILWDIQFNADVNPGNSGGPVVNSNGQVIAVVAKGIPGTQIEFGIPASRLYEFALGSIKSCSLDIKKIKSGLVKFSAKVKVNDPFKNISKIQLLVLPQRIVDRKLIKPVAGTGCYHPLTSNYGMYKNLNRSEGLFTRDFNAKVPDDQDLVCYYQLMIIHKNNKRVFTEPGECYIMSEPDAADRGSRPSSTRFSAINKTIISGGMKIHEFIPRVGKPQSGVISRDGKYLYLLSNNVIYKISTGSLTVEKVYSTGNYCWNIALSKYGLLVGFKDQSHTRNGIMILDQNDLSLLSSNPVTIDDAFRIIAHPGLRYGYIVDHGKDDMFIFDSKLMKVVNKINAEKDLKVKNLATLAISPDGRFFYCKDSKSLLKFKIYGPDLLFILKGKPIMPENGQIAVSPDGNYIGSTGLQAAIYKADDLSRVAAFPEAFRNSGGGFVFDDERQRVYCGNKIYAKDGVLLKKLPSGPSYGTLLFDGKDKLFVCSSSMICVDMNFEIAPSGKTSQTKQRKPVSGDEGGWLGSDSKAKVNKTIRNRVSLAKNQKKIDDITLAELDLEVSNVAGKICWSSDAKSFYVAEKSGIVRKISFPELIMESKIDLNTPITVVQRCKSGVVVLAPEQQVLYLLNEKDLSIQKKIAAPGVRNFSASPNLNIVYAINIPNFGVGTILYFIDTERGGVVKSLSTYATEGPENKRVGPLTKFNFKNCYADIDGKYLLCVTYSPYKLARFKIVNNGLGLVFEEQIERSGVSGHHNFLMESNFLTKYARQKSPTGITHKIQAFNVRNLSSPVTNAEALLLGMDINLKKMYGLDQNMNIKVFDTSGKLLKTYPTHLQHKCQIYNYQGQILVHPDGAKLIAVTRGRIFKIEFPDSPSSTSWRQVKKHLQGNNLLTRTVKTPDMTAAFYDAGGILLPSRDRKGFYAAENGALRKILFDGTLQAIANTSKSIKSRIKLMQSKDGIVWYNKEKLYFFDEQSLRLKRSIDIKGECLTASNLAIAINGYRGKISVIDLKNGKIRHSYTSRELIPDSMKNLVAKTALLGLKGISQDGRFIIAQCGYYTVCLALRGDQLVANSFCKQQKIQGIYGNYVVFINEHKRPSAELIFCNLNNIANPEFKLNIDLKRRIIDIDPQKKTMLVSEDDYFKNNHVICKVGFDGKIIKKYPHWKFLKFFSQYVVYQNCLLTSDIQINYLQRRNCRSALVNFAPECNYPKIPDKDITPVKTTKHNQTIVGIPEKLFGRERTKLNFPFKSTTIQFLWSKDYKHFFILDNKRTIYKISSTNFQVVDSVDFKEEVKSLQQSDQGLLVYLPAFSMLAIVDEKNLTVKDKIFLSGNHQIISGEDSSIALSSKTNPPNVFSVIDLKNKKEYNPVDIREILKKHKIAGNGTPSAKLTPDGKYLFYNAKNCILRFRLTSRDFVLEEIGCQFKAGDIKFFTISNDGLLIFVDVEGTTSISYSGGNYFLLKISGPGKYIFHTNNLSRPEKKLDKSTIISNLDNKLKLGYGNRTIYDANSGMTILNEERGRIYPVSGKKEYLRLGPSENYYVRWGLPYNIFSAPEFPNKKLFGRTIAKKGFSATKLNLPEPSDLLPQCLWEPGTDNIFIGWRNGKIAKIDLKNGIELCTVTHKKRHRHSLEDIALSKHGILAKHTNVRILSTKDLSVIGEIQLKCSRILAHPKLDVVFLLDKEYLMTYDLNLKKVVDMTHVGEVGYYNFSAIAPNGGSVYINSQKQVKVYSIINRRLKLTRIYKTGQLYDYAASLVFSTDSQYCAGLPQKRNQSHKKLFVSKNGTSVCKTNDFNKTVTSIDTGSRISAMGIDSKLKLIYTHVHRKTGDKLVIIQGGKMTEYDLPGYTNSIGRIFVHPEGGRFIVQSNGLYWVKLDSTNNQIIKTGSN